MDSRRLRFRRLRFGRLRFHWSVGHSAGGDRPRGAESRTGASAVPDLAAHVELCRLAEECGIDSLLLPTGFHRADPVAMAAALGPETTRVTFMAAFRSGVVFPTYFVQQVNTVSALTGGRVSVSVVAGHTPAEQRSYGDFLPHDERCRRSDEFWTVCHALWRGQGPVDFEGRYFKVEGARLNTPFVSGGRKAPEIYFGGDSAEAERVAARHGDCVLRSADTPERMGLRVPALREHGVELGMACSLIAMPTRQEAVEAAYALAGRDPAWLTPYLWRGAVPSVGPPAMALVGSADDLADALLAYGRAGVSQFLFQGRPDREAMTFFGQEILPRVRKREPAVAVPAEQGREA